MLMAISGFTFIKNGLTLGYPILESVQSIDPLCKEVIINVGFNNPECSEDDGTYEYLRDHLKGDRYIFLKSWWDPAIQKSGLILSQQTNIALKKCQEKYCQYIQGDEVIHENDLKYIEDGVRKLEKNSDYLGLIFNYIHFYGNVDVYKQTRNVYRREVRLIRNHSQITSHLDAQGFRLPHNEKIKALQTKARIFHYGWARNEQIMAKKVVAFDKLYHGDKELDNKGFKYKREWGLRPFKDTHPKVVENWINNNKNPINPLDLDYNFDIKDLRLILSDLIEYVSGWRMGEYKGFNE